MLVIAQGIATTVAPYLHLGYLSAYADPVSPGYVPVNVPMVASLGIMGVAALCCSVGFALKKRKPLVAVLSLLLSLSCLAIAWGSRHVGPGPPPHEVTTVRAQAILEHLGRRTHVEPPFTSLLDNRLELPSFHAPRTGTVHRSPKDMERYVYKDFWGKEFQVSSRGVTRRLGDSQVNLNEYWLVSAGPDGQFGTVDDLVIDPARLK